MGSMRNLDCVALRAVICAHGESGTSSDHGSGGRRDMACRQDGSSIDSKVAAVLIVV